MEQYINKSDILAEIGRRMELIANASSDNNRELAAIHGAQQFELISLVQYIDALEVKEVHDIWHDVSEKPELEQPLLIIMKGTHKDFRRHYRIGCYGKRANDIPTWVINGCYSDSFISKWCYISDILQYTSEVKEVDLEQEATEFIQTKEFVESTESPVLLIAKHFFELGLKAQMKTSLREKDDGKNT